MLVSILYGIYFYGVFIKIAPKYRPIKKLEKLTQTDSSKIPLHIDAIQKVSYQWCHSLLWGARAKVTYIGLEKVPKGPIVVVSNHQSLFDIPLICCGIQKQIGFIAKKELLKVPLLGSWAANVQCVFLDRSDSRQSIRAIEQGIALLKKGYSIGVFPEGTRSKDPLKVNEFKKGSLRLALKSGVPILPITVKGTAQIFEQTKRIKLGQSLTCIIHDPIATHGLSKVEAAQLSDRVYKIISSAI